MLYKTRAVVLNCVNYSDIYSIVSMFTEMFGPVSYLTAKVNRKMHRTPKALFHPLSVVELDAEHQNLRDIQRIKEMRAYYSLISLRTNPIKSTICIFLAEVASKVLQAMQPEPQLFDFMLQSILVLETLKKDYTNFHLVFMIHMTRFLGFYPDSDGYRQGMYFDLQNGVFLSLKPPHPYYLNSNDSKVFFCLLQMNYENMLLFHLTVDERKVIIEHIFVYYRIHVNCLHTIKSLRILYELFD